MCLHPAVYPKATPLLNYMLMFPMFIKPWNLNIWWSMNVDVNKILLKSSNFLKFTKT